MYVLYFIISIFIFCQYFPKKSKFFGQSSDTSFGVYSSITDNFLIPSIPPYAIGVGGGGDTPLMGGGVWPGGLFGGLENN